MKQKINLTQKQEKAIQALYDNMKKKAIPLGKQLVALERKLNVSFANKSITALALKRQLGAISKIRADLRYVHLVAHIQASKVLTAEQIVLYNKLRGYNAKEPCKHIPKGHNPTMWKKHHGCQ